MNAEELSITKNAPLGMHSAYQIGGDVQTLYIAQTTEALTQAVKQCLLENSQYTVIGSGSHILVADEGYAGSVILNKSSSIHIDRNTKRIAVASGTPIDRIIRECISHEYACLEQLSGVPGTIGGALVVNVADSHGEVSDHFLGADVLTTDGQIIYKDREAFDFDLWSSAISRDEDPSTLLTLYFSLQEKSKTELQEQYLELSRSRSVLAKDSCTYGPYFCPLWEYSVEEVLQDLKWDGKQVGNAKLSLAPYNRIISIDGNATASDVWELSQEIKRDVKEKTEIILTEHIRYIS